MNAAFIAAVVDTLLPGDAGGPAGEPALPAGSAAGIDLSALFNERGAVFEAIAKQAGGADAFIAGGEPTRIVAVQATERAMPEAFRALLSALLADYYESTPVLTAMGWRSDPPQPQGHEPLFVWDTMLLSLKTVGGGAKRWIDPKGAHTHSPSNRHKP